MKIIITILTLVIMLPLTAVTTIFHGPVAFLIMLGVTLIILGGVASTGDTE